MWACFWWSCTRPPSDGPRPVDLAGHSGLRHSTRPHDTGPVVTLDPDDRSWRAPAVARWTGDDPDDEAGTDVCSSDFDGDGRPELIIGAPNTFLYGANPPPHSSVARVPLDALPGPIGARALGEIVGVRNGDLFGSTVVCPGDVTGDGVADVIATGELSEEPPSFVGIYVLSDLVVTTAWEDAWAAIVTGNIHDEALIERAFACGDLNLDGVVEVCSASYIADVAGQDPHDKVVAFQGPVAPGRLRSSEEATWVWSGHDAAALGFRTTGGVDLGGGPAPEIVVGTSEVNANDGAVYVLRDPVPGAFTIEGNPVWEGEEGVGGNAGAGATVGGDLDGDGRNDLFVGAHIADGRGGRGYVLTDATTGGRLADAPIRFRSTSEFDWLGWTAAMGDVDGDGQDDLAVAIPRDRYFGQDQPGRVALFRGPLRPGVYTDLDADLVFRGSDQPDGFGMALWMVDANGDGDDELVVGAPFDGAPVSYRGAVYLFDPSTWSW
jgi:hypothetical protein